MTKMANEVLKDLETAAQVILAPPNHITHEQRRSAETIFLDFRQTKMPYQLCREILETSTVDYVLFESVGLIKVALIREWSLLSKDDLLSLKQYLWHYIINKATIAPFVRERVLQVIAIMVKRLSVEDLGENRKNMLNEIEALVINSDAPRQIVGCGMISALMQEYSTTVKSSDIGLTWEVHFQAKKQFETTDLKRIFKFSISALSQLTKDEILESNSSLVKHLITIVEGVLVWGFIHNGHLSRGLTGIFEAAYESESSPALRLNRSWHDIILDPLVIEVCFTCYWKIRTNPQVAHRALNCLTQLASLNGRVLGTHALKSQYLTDYMQAFLKLVSNIDIFDQEAIGIANIARKLITFFGPTLNSLTPELIRSFMDEITRLTCVFAESATQEETMCAEDCLYMEAFERMLETWLSILSDRNWFPTEFCQQSSIQIFNVYVKCHLSPPDGTKCISNKELEEEIVNSDENDRDKFKKQLQIVGNIGRKVPSHSLIILSQLLENRANKLRQELNHLVAQPKSNLVNNERNSEILQLLYEDLHWLVLLAGHLLCMDSEGEVALIPSEIMRYSMDLMQNGRVDLQKTLQLLASAQHNVSDINGAEESADHVIRLIAAVFRLCEIEKIAIVANRADILSPELSSTLIWFLHRWSLSYLLPIEDYYFEISTTIVEAFGVGSAGSQWAINFLLDKVQQNIETFHGEVALVEQVIQLLLALVTAPSKASLVLKSERLGQLIELATRRKFGFPRAATKGLTSAIVQIGVAVENRNNKEQYWLQTIQPLQDRFKQIVSREDLVRLYHCEDVKFQVIDVLDCFIGVVQGVNTSTVKSIFNYVSPILAQLPNLLSLYHNYQQLVQLILELLCECSRGMLCYLDQSESIRIYEVCLHTIQVYARCNINRVAIDVTAEENTFQDILLLMQLLTNLLSKDMFDLSCTEHQVDHEQQSVTPADVFLYGLNIIMPLMTFELLKFPSLCQQYFKMITFVCEIHPKKVCDLPNELLGKLLSSVELGLTSFGHEITALCCDIIQVMGQHIYTEIEKGQPRNQLMAPFMNLLMNFILSHQINSDLISNTGTSLYYLICCYQELYQQLVQDFLAAQSDAQMGQRLAAAFTDLTAHVLLNTERAERLKFKDNFDKFVVTVQGFMIIK